MDLNNGVEIDTQCSAISTELIQRELSPKINLPYLEGKNITNITPQTPEINSSSSPLEKLATRYQEFMKEGFTEWERFTLGGKMHFKNKLNIPIDDVRKKRTLNLESKSRNDSYSKPSFQNKSNQKLNNQKVMTLKRSDGFVNDIKVDRFILSSTSGEGDKQIKTIYRNKNSTSVTSLAHKPSKAEEAKFYKEMENKYTQLSKCYSNRRQEIIQTLQRFPVIGKPKAEGNHNKSMEPLRSSRIRADKGKEKLSILPKVL